MAVAWLPAVVRSHPSPCVPLPSDAEAPLPKPQASSTSPASLR